MKKSDIKWLIVLAMVCFVVFANGVGGEFVYDDNRQIVRNTLIQNNDYIWKALTSDVWAFKGGGSQTASNYWRPTFTAWHIFNFRLFGMNPFGWHIANLVLHSSVCVLAFSLLRRWAFPAMIAFTIALIFAVHPVHVESVTWISGSPDLLFSLAFLGSLWFATSYRENRSNANLLLTVVLYLIALGAKEIGIFCLPIFYLILVDKPDKKKTKAGVNNAALSSLVIAAAAYFLARWAVLGSISRPSDDPVDFSVGIMSIPAMFVFYLKQIVAPLSVAVNYTFPPVSQIGAENFFIPLIISLAVLAGIAYLVKYYPETRIGAALFLLPLIPAMNATAFISEQLVHDRYLYLPLLGALMLIVPFAVRFASERVVLIAGCVIAAALAFQTFRYNTAWANDLTLWAWTAKVDNSSFTLMQLGSSLSEAGRVEDSVVAYSAAIAKKPSVRGYLGRARGYLTLKQYQNAEKDLADAFAQPKDKQEWYAMYQAYEALGIAYQDQQKYDAAAKLFRDARTALPIYQAALTEKLAIVLYQSGQKGEALRELESMRAQAKSELLPESKSVFLRLGMLYGELGRKDDAKAALNEYLRSTASINDKNTIDGRNQATRLLENLK
jgi:tetratricopeptide (TPR) repeat protein